MPQPTRYQRAVDLDSWLSDARIRDGGFTHRWVSEVSPDNGEDLFIDILGGLAGSDDVILDVGCGHGELTLSLAADAREAIGVDRDLGYLTLARELAVERGVPNARFIEFGFAPGLRLPIEDGSVSLIVDRRGPTVDRWFDEARRVARPGANVLMLHPAGGPPPTSWSARLPASLADRFDAIPFERVRDWVERPLAGRGISDLRLWWVDVPEWFTSIDELYRRLTAGRADAKMDVEEAAALSHAMARFGSARGLALRHQRLIAHFTLPATGS